MALLSYSTLQNSTLAGTNYGANKDRSSKFDQLLDQCADRFLIYNSFLVVVFVILRFETIVSLLLVLVLALLVNVIILLIVADVDVNRKGFDLVIRDYVEPWYYKLYDRDDDALYGMEWTPSY